MICTQCKHRNGIGNKFCRECGTPLPLPDSPLALEEASRAERERLTERVSGLLAAAYTLAEQKRYDQALPLAEEAVLLLPDSTAALSLLTTLYEYSGQDEKAIRTMERVVALNPESPGDRQKLGQLRQAFAQAQSDEPFPLRGVAATAGRAATNPAPRPAHSGLVGLPVARRPYLPYILGGAAAACVVGAGLAANSNRHGRQDAPATNVERGNLGNLGSAGANSAELAARALSGASSASQNASNPLPATAAVPATIPTYQAGADPFVNHGGNSNNGVSNGGGGYSTYNAPRASSGNRYRNYGNSGGYSGNGSNGVSLPSFRQMNSGGSDNGDSGSAQPIAPIIAVAPGSGENGGAQSQSPYGPTESNSAPVRIAAGPPPTTTVGGGTGGSASGATGGDKGYMSITVGTRGSHPSGASSNGGGSSSESAGASRGSSGSSGGGGSALSRARNAQATGRYSEAVGAYREAINSDASGSAWQGLAQSLESQHDRAAARDAYRNALHAYESQLAAGRNPAAAQRGIDSSKAGYEANSE